MFLSRQVNFFSRLVLGQVDFCNISTALLVQLVGSREVTSILNACLLKIRSLRFSDVLS